MNSVLVQYVFLDVIDFTHNDRSVEDMVSIIETMNQIVRIALNEQGLEEQDVVLLPTGDGMCIALLNQGARNTHIEIAEAIRAYAQHHRNLNARSQSAFDLHIAVDEGKDTIIQDITGRRNLIGPAINRAARLMNSCASGEIVISSVVFENTAQLAKYKNRFKPRPISLKNGHNLQSYYHRPEGIEDFGALVHHVIGAATHDQGHKLTVADLARLQQGAKIFHSIYGLGTIVWLKERTGRTKEARISFGRRQVEVILTAGMDLYFTAVPKEQGR